jgi:Cys-rich protein (TIGR01571 family)
MNGEGSYTPLEQDQNVGEDLLLQPEIHEDAVAVAEPMIQVKAPATLSEGYKLDVQVGPRTFTVTIPAGGVQEGQSFQVPLPGGGDTDLSQLQTAVARIAVPTGQWRDGICDCFNNGICHTMLLNSIFCHSIALAQIMTRFKLNLLASPIEMRHGAREAARITFKVILAWTLVAVGFRFFLFPRVIVPLNSHIEKQSIYEPMLEQYLVVERRVINDGALGVLKFFKHVGDFLHYSMLIAVIFWMTRTRAYIRQKYGIPVQYCKTGPVVNASGVSNNGCKIEDCCLSTFCACCTVSQMARHTMEYDTYHGTCCTPTGVRDSVPDIV